MHLSTLLTTLTTLGLATLTSAAALDTTTSAPTSCTNSGVSSTCSASTSTSTTTSASDSTGPQSIEEYIKAKQAQIAAENSNNNNSTMTYNVTSTRHVGGMNAYEVPMCCVNGCRVCSAKICGKGVDGCNDWPFYSCCSTIILWDTEKNVMLDTFTTEGETVEFQYD